MRGEQRSHKERGRKSEQRKNKRLRWDLWSGHLPLYVSWIIERLDRKLADVIGSKIVGKCHVTLPRAIQPLKSDVLRVLFFLAYFTISVFDYTDCPCFEVKDEEDLLLEKTVREYKTSRGKIQSKWPWNLWERRLTPAPDSYAPNGKPNYIRTIRKQKRIHLQNTYKKGIA